MPAIKPVSDLRNYNEVLRNIASGQPVFLTKNGRGRYVIEDIKDYEKRDATIQLLAALDKGRISGEKEGYFTLEEIRNEFGLSGE
jgi:prevent-host-death family protein